MGCVALRCVGVTHPSLAALYGSEMRCVALRLRNSHSRSCPRLGNALRCIACVAHTTYSSLRRSLAVVVQPLAPVSPAATGKCWTEAELRKQPAAERDAILAGQAAHLEDECRNNPELTAFYAFGDEDLYAESSDTETR
jgi:hypothetical protein